MQRWTTWYPIGVQKGIYSLVSLSSPEYILSITLLSQRGDHKVELIYDDWVDSFAYRKKSDCGKFLEKISAQYGDDFCNDWSFFKVINSEYLDRIFVTSAGVSEMHDFEHYCIITKDEIIDIIHQDHVSPKIKIVK